MGQYTVGLGGSLHDYAACILHDGLLVATVEEERVTRKKNGLGLGTKLRECQALQVCLKQAGLRLEQVDKIYINDILNPLYYLSLKDKTVAFNHHLTHAANVYYNSGVEESAILIVDGVGSQNRENPNYFETVTLAVAKGEKIEIIDRVYGRKWESEQLIENSLGHFYLFFTRVCGFKDHQEGKTMGLAPYGDNRYLKELAEVVQVHEDGQLTIKECDMLNLKNFFEQELETGTADSSFFLKACIAKAVQSVFEEALLKLVSILMKRVSTKVLCYSGGAALNCVANAKIKNSGWCDVLHLNPAGGDSGTALGAALLGARGSGLKLSGSTTPYQGVSYSQVQVKEVLQQYQSELHIVESVSIIEDVAKNLAEGKVVGWFQGRSEVGPRALGNRSILADPRQNQMQDYINTKIKMREDFRPFAPVILAEDVETYFNESFDSPYMLYTFMVNETKRSLIPAVVHVDGSARVQTIVEQDNATLYQLLQSFKQLTGIPILLNTSFNVGDEPIVESPEDAIKTFLNSELDLLYLESHLCVKRR